MDWIGLSRYIVIRQFIAWNRVVFKRGINETWRVVYLVSINYFFFEYTVRKLSRRKIGRSFLRVAAQIFLCSFGLYAWRGIGIGLHIYTSFAQNQTNSHIVGDQFGESIGFVLFFIIVRHFYHYVKLQQTAQRLLIEKQAAELNYLRSQTNPHFLFNTLNNIYSLARDKSDLAPESILRLSKILRFMLYDTSGEYIAIEQELKIIDDYLALEKLRYDDSLRVNFNYGIEDMKQALPPLLLIPLVENAFKHGVSETRNQPFVDIHLSVNRQQLSFVVKNSSESFTADTTVKENIGLSNLRRQLELLYTDFSLSAIHGTAIFTATLKSILAAMSKIRCIIIEDEPLAVKILSDYILQLPFLELQGSFKDAIIATEYLRDNTTDLIFLDIHLPKLKGMAFLKTLALPPAVIITTAYHQYAVEGFDLNVTDYLLKPFEFERFLTAVQKVKAAHTKNEEIKDHLFLTVQKKKVKILFSEIVYIESQREYIKIVTAKAEYITKMSTHEIEAILPGSLFKRVHRSFIISIKRIESYTAESVDVSGISIPIGRGYRDITDNL